MNINELGEDLEQQFGKPRNITEENVRFMLSLIKEEYDGTKVNENVEKPSLEAFGMTILAVMSYQTTPWEELAKKPSIRKTLKYIAIRGNSHYDEMEALTKELIRKHFDGITQKMVLGFLKIIRGVSNEERPTKLIEYTPFAAQYLNPAKRNVLDLKNETCKNREKRNVQKNSRTRHFKTTKKQSKTGCFYSF